MFDILVLLLLGILAIVILDMAFKSRMALKKAKIFAEMQLEMMADSTNFLRSVSEDLKEFNGKFKEHMSAKKEEIKQSGIQCERYHNGTCKLCGGSGECLLDTVENSDTKSEIESIIKNLETMATKPQKRKVTEK